MPAPFIDFHCHPALKPFGKSFGRSGPGRNLPDPKRKTSLWHRDPPALLEKGLQSLTGVCKFTQADCSTLLAGNTRVVCASLYPVERAFFRNKLGENCTNQYVNAFVTSVGRNRVRAVQQMRDYHADLMAEYDFYRQLDGQTVQTDGGEARYRLVRDWAQLERQLGEPEADRTVFIILTIEGLHVLNTDIDGEPNRDVFLNNARALKNWQ